VLGPLAGVLSSSHRQAKGRKAAARVLALGAAAAVGWLLAPALSAQPYQPAARDFEQPLPAVERIAGHARAAESGHDHHGPVTHLSPVIEAPARFDAVGIARELRLVEIRARDAGGEWSGWIEIANGDPAWFGGADELQLRTRGWRPRGTLHYVNVSGDSTAAEGLLTDVREAVNGAVVAATDLLSADLAAADPGMPDVVSRRAWGAERRNGGCKPRRRPDYGVVRAAVVHHTVGSNTYSRAEAPDVVLAICRYHRNAQRWDDIGYNALVDRFGTIYAGRDGGLGRAVVGAQAQGVNAQTTGVAVMGTYSKKGVSSAAKRGLTRWLAWKLVKHNKTTKGRARLVSAGGETSRYRKGERFRTKRIIGHRKTNLTECPGNGINRRLGDLRRRVQNVIEREGGPKNPGGGGGGGVGR
jgi:N-acetylmuramoyl-L-alanine amidase